jgi:hypothetical protein
MFPAAPATELELTPQGEPFLGELFSPSPFHFRFTGEDALEIASYNSQSGVRVAVQGRTWHPREGIRPFAFSHVPNTDRTRALERFGIADGYLLNVVVFAASGAPSVGQTFVSLQVTRGEGSARYLLATLLQGYITAEQELGFPGSPIQESLAVQPVPRIITGTNPPAGVQISETVPAGARWRVHAFYAVLTTSAAAATRRARLEIGFAGANLTIIGSDVTQTASLDQGYSWGEGLAASAAAAGIYVTNPHVLNLWLPAGVSIGTNVDNFQAGDNWSAPVMTVSELLEAQ